MSVSRLSPLQSARLSVYLGDAPLKIAAAWTLPLLGAAAGGLGYGLLGEDDVDAHGKKRDSSLRRALIGALIGGGVGAMPGLYQAAAESKPSKSVTSAPPKVDAPEKAEESPKAQSAPESKQDNAKPAPADADSISHAAPTQEDSSTNPFDASFKRLGQAKPGLTALLPQVEVLDADLQSLASPAAPQRGSTAALGVAGGALLGTGGGLYDLRQIPKARFNLLRTKLQQYPDFNPEHPTHANQPFPTNLKYISRARYRQDALGNRFPGSRLPLNHDVYRNRPATTTWTPQFYEALDATKLPRFRMLRPGLGPLLGAALGYGTSLAAEKLLARP